MLNPGLYDLVDRTITTAAEYTSDAVEDLDGIFSLGVQLRFTYGSGGTAARVYIQTSFDQAVTWVDIACVLFTTASAHKLLNLSALTPKTSAVTPTDGAMTDDTALDGFLGDRVRVKLISTGTYAGTTQLTGRIVAR